MTLTEGFVKDELFIDFGAEVMYGDDQVYIDYPCRFATVQFQLMATNGLTQIADRIRKDAEYKPMHPMDEYTDETCDMVCDPSSRQSKNIKVFSARYYCRAVFMLLPST